VPSGPEAEEELATVTIPARQPFWRRRLQDTFTALGYRNYRWWFGGQVVSLMGTWMQMTAQGFLVFELTRSAAYLGYVAFAAGIPPWLFMLYAGVVADRVSRRRLLMITQSTMMALALVLATLTLAGAVRAWHIVVLAFLLGIANAFEAPARQAFVLELVDREDLTNAIALNATMFNGASAVGPAVAGIIYAAFGPAWCFIANALSFVAVLFALAMIRPKPQELAGRGRSALSDLVEGLRFVATHPHVRVLIGLVMMVTLFGISMITLIPAWAVRVLGGDATTNGFLQSARGVGALVGALAIASLGRFAFRGRLLTAGSLVLPLALLLFSQVRTEALSIAWLVVVGMALIATLNLCNSLVQTISPDSLRGRVMGVHSLALFGFLPIGGLIAGTVAEHIGEPTTVVISASTLLAITVATRILQPGLSALP
jgi:MFS family permease